MKKPFVILFTVLWLSACTHATAPTQPSTLPPTETSASIVPTETSVATEPLPEGPGPYAAATPNIVNSLPFPVSLTLTQAITGLGEDLSLPLKFQAEADFMTNINKTIAVHRAWCNLDAPCNGTLRAIYSETDHRWTTAAMDAQGNVTEWMLMHTDTGDHWGEQPFWDSLLAGKTTAQIEQMIADGTIEFTLPPHTVPDSQFKTMWQNGFPILIEADKDGKPFQWQTLNYGMRLLEGAEIPIPPLPELLQSWAKEHPDFQWQGLVDNSGFHLDLGGGRIIDIPSEQMSARIKIDQFALLQVYDEQKIITAEYDPDQKSWVDIQKLADNLSCQRGPTCFNNARNTPIPGGIDVELSSTGIFKYTDALNKNTGEKIGNFLLTQMVTKNEGKLPVTVWVLVQAESFSEPRVNAFDVGVSVIRYRVEGRGTTKAEDLMLYPIQQWQEWMPKGLKWTLEFSKINYVYPFLTFIQESQIMSGENQSEARNFLTSSGADYGNDFILQLIASAP